MFEMQKLMLSSSLCFLKRDDLNRCSLFPLNLLLFDPFESLFTAKQYILLGSSGSLLLNDAIIAFFWSLKYDLGTLAGIKSFNLSAN